MKYEEKTMLPVTNREKLRNMDDGELAAFFAGSYAERR